MHIMCVHFVLCCFPGIPLLPPQIELFSVCVDGCPSAGDLVCTDNGTQALTT